MDQSETRQLAVSLTMTPELAAELQREQGALTIAQGYTITGNLEERNFMAKEANSLLRTVKATIARLKEKKQGFVAPAKQIIANAEALFDPAIAACTDAETFLKGQLSAHVEYCKKLEDDARRQREAEERAARQKAEQEAAAARAKAEAEAREKARIAQEAEDRRIAAEKAGDARGAKAAAAQKAKAEEQARAAVENGEAKALELTLAASAAPTATVVTAPTKLEGFSTRDHWVCEIEAGLDEVEVAKRLIAAIAGVPVAQFVRPDLMALLAYDSKAAGRLAAALKKGFNVPGLVAINKPIAASRAA